MSVLNLSNVKKTLYYLKRNGLGNTISAAKERLEQSKGEAYHFEPMSSLERKAARDACQEMIETVSAAGKTVPTFSILVPAYRTSPVFLKELAESVQSQTYPKWELLILDASGDSSVKDALKEFCIVKGLRLSEESPKDGKSGEGKKTGATGNSCESGDDSWMDGLIRYIPLSENGGISENTNAGLPLARGEYIGLLDHDDVLTEDALQCMADAILEARARAVSAVGASVQETTQKKLQDLTGLPARLLYSDEDKWNGEADGYYEPHSKEDFNLDLLYSNNYICHFLVLEAELFRSLKLRKEYDGAQDYDLVLRASEKILQDLEELGEEKGLTPAERRELEKFCLVHISRVLYHWRCHAGSTAENPQSKLYAYEAGCRALQDTMDRQGITAHADHLQHVGFYRLRYYENGPVDLGKNPLILHYRKDLGAVGGKVICSDSGQAREMRLKKGSMIGGRMDFDGRVYYYGLKPGYSGYMHRAALTQNARAVDIRCICVAEEYHELFCEITGVPYVTIPGTHIFDASTLPGDCDVKQLSLAFCRALGEQGKRILWDPSLGMA